MDSGTCTILYGIPGGIDVSLVCASQARDSDILECSRDLPDRLKLALRGDGKSRLYHIHTQFFELERHTYLLLQRHTRAGRLLAVSERGIEYVDLFCHFEYLSLIMLKRNYCRSMRCFLV